MGIRQPLQRGGMDVEPRVRPFAGLAAAEAGACMVLERQLKTPAVGGRGTARSSECLAAVRERRYTSSMDYRERITIEPGKRGGKPCLRGLRITVYDVLDYLAGGMSEDEILADFPDLEREDIRAALAFAADRERRLAGDVAA